MFVDESRAARPRAAPAGPPRALAAALAVLVAAAAPRPARAQDAEGEAPAKPSYRVTVDRVRHEPTALGGTRLTLDVSALTLQGQRLELEPGAIEVRVSGSELRAPVAIGSYEAAARATAIVFVVQATLEYTEALPAIAETLDAGLLAKLPEGTTQIAVLAYGEQTGSGKLGALKGARAKLKEVGSDGSTGDPALVETVERALLLLRRAKPPEGYDALRKIIVVIGDGKDRLGDRERVTRLGTRAAKDGVRIHALAFSPADQRRPLLLLGELARRSLGTFRWLRNGTADAWTAQWAQLLDELQRQYVLTFFLDADGDPAGKKLVVQTVGRTEATTADRQADLKVPAAGCAGEPRAGYCAAGACVVPRVATGRGVLGWALIIGGGAVGVVVLLGFIGFLMSRRGGKVVAGGALPPGVIPGVPGAFPPGVVPGGVPGRPPTAPPAAAAPAAAPGHAAGYLMFLTGPRAGERVALRHGFWIGKAPGCDLLIEDGYTSSHHAQLGMDGRGGWMLYDRGSTNGTLVNGVRVAEAALEHGATIKIGSTDLRFLSH